jgi:hypothetical protein
LRGRFFEEIADRAAATLGSAKQRHQKINFKDVIWEALGNYGGDRTEAFRTVQHILTMRSATKRRAQTKARRTSLRQLELF